jgi:hypothetical protein
MMVGILPLAASTLPGIELTTLSAEVFGISIGVESVARKRQAFVPNAVATRISAFYDPGGMRIVSAFSDANATIPLPILVYQADMLYSGCAGVLRILCHGAPPGSGISRVYPLAQLSEISGEA